MADSLTNQVSVSMNESLNHWLDSFKTVDLFSTESLLCVDQRLNGSTVALNGMIFICKMQQKQTILNISQY